MLGVALRVVGALTGVPLHAMNVAEAASLSAETSIGSAPRQPGGESELTFAEELRPGAAVRFSTPRSALTLRIEPRFYYRQPNLGGLDRPLSLLRSTGRYRLELSPRLQWSTQASASYGEVDYTNVDIALVQPIATRLSTPVLSVFQVEGDSGLTWKTSARANAGLSLLAGYTQPLDPDQAGAIPETLSVGASVRRGYALDPRSGLLATIRALQYKVEPGPDWSTLAGILAYEHILASSTTISASAGVGLAQAHGEAPTVFAEASLALERVLRRRAAMQITNRLALSLDSTFDSVLGRVRPIAGVESSLNGQLGTKWSVLQRAGAYTSASSEPLAPDSLETSVDTSLGFAYEVRRNVRLEFGMRLALFGSHWAASDFEFSDRQLWGFLRFVAVIGKEDDASGLGWAL